MNVDFRKFIFGGVSGSVGVFLSYPFDVLKTVSQDKSYHKLKIKNIYKGVLTPMIGITFEKSMTFGLYKNLNEKLPTPIAGAISGLGASLVVTPVEKIKIMYQVNKKIDSISFKKLYKGILATTTREVPGFAIYFTTYEWLKGGRNLKSYESFLYGSISGGVSWVFIYPQDTIKTIIQSESNSGYIKIATLIYNNGGLFSFYRGFHFALLRALPLHGGTFMTMEFLTQHFNE